MAAIEDLLAEIDDDALRAQLRDEYDKLTSRRSVGLVYESHLPEKVRLPGHEVRRGLTVEEKTADKDAIAWRVVKIRNGEAVLRHTDKDGTTTEAVKPVSELVVIREFGDPIYPGLKSVGRVERGGDKPFHTVINSENYHALETLLYTCEGQVDCIYIDPPYNTGARDWKYNNDYVDSEDGYRHSKWLSFMEKRLELAKRLLNPESSVLVVTIDEHEDARLWLLLEQMFPGATIQRVTYVINPGGVTQKQFSRVDEYAFFCFIGDARVTDGLDTGLGEEVESTKHPTWENLLRRGSGGQRKDSPTLFYPLFVDASGRIQGAGEALALSVDRSSISPPPGCRIIWPTRTDGSEGRWRLGRDRFLEQLGEGTVRVGSGGGVLYALSKVRAALKSGEVEATGRRPDGSLELVWRKRLVTPKTVWSRPRHNASTHGTNLLTALLGERGRFTFPKSLYAVRDAVYAAVGAKKNALIIDFFAGSGTTAHAVALMNAEDGGTRRSISITNNELSDETASRLRRAQVEPGSSEWESHGIFESVTRARMEAAITGRRADGSDIPGAYLTGREMADGFEENIEFLTLTYEDADRVKLGAAFEAVAPILWMKAGAQGPRVDRRSGAWALPEGGRYGVLFDPNDWVAFTTAVLAAESVTHAFIVTDSDAVFHRVVAELPDGVEPVRLYESYLSSFAINTGAVT